ncbi:MAG: hypothetical protein WCY05_06145 [Candidatus Omnitrophota bacterium]
MSVKDKIFVELRTFWGNVLYITVFFSIFTDYKRLILAHYNISYGFFGISFIKALVLAKVILIAEHLHLGEGLEKKPLIYPTLYKTALFTFCVAILSIIEALVRALLKNKGIIDAPAVFINCLSYEWFAEMFTVFILFIPFFGIKELGRVMGRGKIKELFFRRRAGSESNFSDNKS